MFFKKASVCALLLAGVAWAESDPNADADPYYQLSPYRTYNTHGGYPYRSSYYSPYAAYRQRPSILSPSAAYQTRYASASHPEVYAAPAPVAAPVAPAPATTYLRPVPAVPEVASAVYEAAPAPAPTPVVYEAAPAPAPTPVAPVAAAYDAAVPSPTAPNDYNPIVATQFHAQDEFGNVAYGYANPNAAKEERRDAYGNVRGAYSYIDGTGLPKHVAYVADDYGFRVTSSNALPVAPALPAAGH